MSHLVLNPFAAIALVAYMAAIVRVLTYRRQGSRHRRPAPFHLLNILPGFVIVPNDSLNAMSQFAALVDRIKPHRKENYQ